MKRTHLTIFFAVGLVCSCNDVEFSFDSSSHDKKQNRLIDMPIVLGDSIEIPYTVDHLRECLKRGLDETKSLSVEDIRPTNTYVRFSPQNEQELSELKNDSLLILYEYPLDRELLVAGSSYHDPNLPSDVPTFQYCSVPYSYWVHLRDTLPIQFTELYDVVVPEELDVLTKSLTTEQMSSLQYLISYAFQEYYPEDSYETKASNRWCPSGYVYGYDNIVDGYVPIASVHVRARHLLHTEQVYTTTSGYYYMPDGFKNPAQISVVWESPLWDIRDGATGQAYLHSEESVYGQSWNAFAGEVTKQAGFAAIHRAAYRTYYGANYWLSRPGNSRKEKISYLYSSSQSAGVYYCQFGAGAFSDLYIYGEQTSGNHYSPSSLFTTTCHELAHCAMYLNSPLKYASSTNFIRESWATCVEYALTHLEYQVLGVLGALEPVERLSVYGISKTVVVPNADYNFQSWNHNSTQVDYSPIFIDFIDDFNQREYYEIKYLRGEEYCDDRISNLPISYLEEIVFENTSLSSIKQALIGLSGSWNSGDFTIENINRIFDYYE